MSEWVGRNIVNPYDQRFLQTTLDAMKLNQGSLQQLMTLSAAGLALYFGFIGKAPFVEALRLLGVLVVLSWIVSLCAAVVAHRLHGNLFMSLCQISSSVERVLALYSLPDEVDESISHAIDAKRVVDAAKAKLVAARQAFEFEYKAFEKTFFPIQTRVIQLTSASLWSFVFGFVFLGAGYVVWVFNA